MVCTVLGTPEAMKKLFLKRNTIYFDVLEVIEPEEVSKMSTAELSERIHSEMQENIEMRKKQLCSEK